MDTSISLLYYICIMKSVKECYFTLNTWISLSSDLDKTVLFEVQFLIFSHQISLKLMFDSTYQKIYTYNNGT